MTISILTVILSYNLLEDDKMIKLTIHYKNGDVVTKDIDMNDYIEYLENSLTKIRKHVNKLEVQVV